jgi:hypothetical protein
MTINRFGFCYEQNIDSIVLVIPLHVSELYQVLKKLTDYLEGSTTYLAKYPAIGRMDSSCFQTPPLGNQKVLVSGERGNLCRSRFWGTLASLIRLALKRGISGLEFEKSACYRWAFQIRPIRAYKITHRNCRNFAHDSSDHHSFSLPQLTVQMCNGLFLRRIQAVIPGCDSAQSRKIGHSFSVRALWQELTATSHVAGEPRPAAKASP